MSNKRKNFTEGPLFWRLSLFAIPIMLTGFLQIAYNMADNVVVGKFSGDPLALAAVGSTSTLNTLIVNLLMGVGGGAGIAVAQWYGAADHKRVSEGVHTSLLASLIGGVAVCIIGFLISKPALVMLGTKEEVLESATLYLRIICLGIPGNAVYNFAAGILRGTGNSRAPLIILASSGLVNVILNIVFVMAFHMTVDGVAVATIVSQYASAVVAVAVLASKKGESYCFRFKELCIKKAALQRILRLGIPMGLQGTFYSITNLVMVISINTFPTAAVTANTIAGNIDAVTWTVINSFGQATTTFTGQNYGARNPERVKRVIYYGLLQTTVTVILIAFGELLFSDLLIKMFLDSTNPENPLIIGYAKEIMLVMLTSYVIFGVVDGSQASMRGLGHSLCPTLITMICICGIRISWILAAAPRFNSLWGLYLAFPLSWVVGGAASVIALVIYYRRFGRKFGAKPEFKDTAVPVSD